MWTDGRTFLRLAVAGLLGAVVVGVAVMTAQLGDPAGGGEDRFAAPPVKDCSRPYADTSPWNTPIPTSAQYMPDGADRVRTIDGLLTSDPTQYTYPVYEVDRRTRRVDVRFDGRFSHVSDNNRRLELIDGGTVRMPIPADAEAAAGSDAQIIVIDRETGDEWGAWRLRRMGDGWRMENGYRYNVRWSGVPPRDEAGNPFGSRGAGVPYLAGLVRPCEIERGRIEHALAFAYDWPTAEYVYPASKSDGASDDPRGLPEGTRLQLDPELDSDDLEGFGCLGPCAVIARALQRYGMYVIDNAGRPKIMLEYHATAGWPAGIDAMTVTPLPLSSFRVLEPARPGD